MNHIETLKQLSRFYRSSGAPSPNADAIDQAIAEHAELVIARQERDAWQKDYERLFNSVKEIGGGELIAERDQLKAKLAAREKELRHAEGQMRKLMHRPTGCICDGCVEAVLGEPKAALARASIPSLKDKDVITAAIAVRESAASLDIGKQGAADVTGGAASPASATEAAPADLRPWRLEMARAENSLDNITCGLTFRNGFHAAIAWVCRISRGPCFCGCHRGTTTMDGAAPVSADPPELCCCYCGTPLVVNSLALWCYLECPVCFWSGETRHAEAECWAVEKERRAKA